ncbi:MAG: hypothetical protein V4561_06945 [Bacteroidota bacterium]
METILIPIDFNVESLLTLRIALNHHTDGKINVILMYSESLSDSITDLLFYNPQKTIKSLLKPDFEEALSIIKNRYETTVHHIRIELFHGYNSNSLKRFIEAKRISNIYLPKNYQLKPPKNGFDPINLFKKSQIDFKEIEWSIDKNTHQQMSLISLFVN